MYPGIPGKVRTTGLIRWVTEHRYGSPTFSVFSTPNTGPAVVRYANNKPDRTALLTVNLGAFVVYISTDGVPNSLNGIPIQPNGAVYMNQADDDTLVTEAWYVVSPGGAGQLYTIETQANIQGTIEEK